MTIQRMEHVGIVVDDLAAATAFFVELGLKLQERDEQEDHAAERRIGHQREHGGAGELAGAKQFQRKHRVSDALSTASKGRRPRARRPPQQ